MQVAGATSDRHRSPTYVTLSYMGEKRFPRSVVGVYGDEHREILRDLSTGAFPESDILAALEDPDTDAFTQEMALGSLGMVHGDDRRVGEILRRELALASQRAQRTRQCACIGGLVGRLGLEAVPDLESLWAQKIPRDVRDLILEAFGHLGVTAHYQEALALFERGLKGGRQWSGGIYMPTLSSYLFACVRNGVGSGEEIKALIRANRATIPIRGGFADGYGRLLPGIYDPDVALAEIPDPVSLWNRWNPPPREER